MCCALSAQESLKKHCEKTACRDACACLLFSLVFHLLFSFSVCLLSLSLSVCLRVLLWWLFLWLLFVVVVVVVSREGVWCDTLKKTVCPSKTSPCVRPKRPRVYRHHAHKTGITLIIVTLTIRPCTQCKQWNWRST